jgi:Peptidase family M48
MKTCNHTRIKFTGPLFGVPFAIRAWLKSKFHRCKQLKLTTRCFCLFSLLVTAVVPLLAQLDPESAQVISYFPQFVDGGSDAQKWTTSLTLINPHLTLSAGAMVNLYDDNGASLSLDFGNGPVSKLTVTIPPQGSVTYKSLGTASSVLTGWAVVVSNLPLEGVIQFSYSANGVPQQGVSAESTPASTLFRSPASSSTGIALANTNSVSIPVTVTAIDTMGSTVAQTSVTLSAFNHRSLSVAQLFPALPTSFRGTVLMGAPTSFVAWTLSADGGVISSYPPGGLDWPVSQYERIWKIWFKVLSSAATGFSLGTPPNLVIDYSAGQINAFANTAANEVHVSLNLAELISDSESELAFIIGHALGHIIQAKTQQLVLVPFNAEADADQYAVLFALGAGFDPYAGAGALGKLLMVSGPGSLLAQNFDNLTTDPHTSFNNRLPILFTDLQTICSSSTTLQNLCAQYKILIHPDLPSAAPLIESRRKL